MVANVLSLISESGRKNSVTAMKGTSGRKYRLHLSPPPRATMVTRMTTEANPAASSMAIWSPTFEAGTMYWMDVCRKMCIRDSLGAQRQIIRDHGILGNVLARGYILARHVVFLNGVGVLGGSLGVLQPAGRERFLRLIGGHARQIGHGDLLHALRPVSYTHLIRV